ncbi:beta-galactosidase, partial [Arthrobacter sp.]|uniref:beta-galactosidase n=1 Tax=Arthrobacter sp. TaxID=1667 RepID=UPI0028124CF7
MPVSETFRQPNQLVYGGDYNPEQWPESVWLEDVRLMREAHVNRVTIGVFSWSSIEPREGDYEFGWLDRIMDLMAENGIGVVLATPTASPPPWFSLAHPEALPVTADGVRLIHGSRDTYNPAAPAYRKAARRVTSALAERYSSHPALTMWHLHNEYGTVSYGPETDTAFREWLRGKYGSLAQLNTTWNTAFWSQRYGEWDEIFAPQATQYLPNPSHLLDFKRFSADLLRDCLREQVEIVRSVRADVPVTTNFMLPSWNHYDQWDFAAEIDDVSVDHYPDT